jgi:Fe-S-cluster containining protein
MHPLPKQLAKESQEMALPKIAPPPLAVMIQPGNPDVCRRCAEQGRSCCQILSQAGESFFPISKLETARIRRILPWIEEESLVFSERNAAAFQGIFEELFPLEKAATKGALTPEGEFRRLASGPAGSCVCLGPHGCLLPYDCRPLYCQLFPFWVKEGQIYVQPHSACLALKEARSLSHLLELLGTTRETVLSLHDQLCKTWGLGRRLPPPAARLTPERGKTRSRRPWERDEADSIFQQPKIPLHLN